MTKRWMSLGLVGAAAVVAVGAGAVAVNAAAPGTGRSVLSEDDVARQLAAQPGDDASTSPAPLPSAVEMKAVTTDSGTVVVACLGNKASLARWTPKTGFRVDALSAGPASQASIIFKSANSEVTVVATCPGGVPTIAVHHDDNHGGTVNGGSGGGGSGGGGADDPADHH
jgi:lipoprotein-anchoring transpeptidase ErfK/SrfK